MKIRNVLSMAIFLGTSSPHAATLYVSLASTNPVTPYASWSTAATNIQDAIGASSTGDLILVTNGVYQSGIQTINGENRVAVTNSVTIQSVNGPAVTLIDGGQMMRCVYLTNDTALIGFTLTNGKATYLGEGNPGGTGGGAWCADSSVVLSNCVLVGNSAPEGGGVSSGTLYNCTLMENDAADAGGGAYSYSGDCTLNNCLIVSNSTLGQLSGGGAYGCTLNNCTVVDNIGLGVLAGYYNNCIIYYNDRNYYLNDKILNSFINCITTPLPSSDQPVCNVITNAPLFANTNDFHLQPSSPCINSGNNALAVGATDLDGNPRIIGGSVDLGCYEYQTPVSMISYAWLEQYGLPIDTIDFRII